MASEQVAITRLAVLFIVALLFTGATMPRHHIIHAPNAAFFLATHYEALDAIQSYALTLCLQDKLTDDTPSAILAAGAICQDSRRNSDGDSLSHDGMWRGYTWAAYAGIVAMCRGEVDELCRWFR